VIAAATAADANILIVGRRPPRGDLKERLVGDVAAQIIAQAHCHVLIAGWQSQMWSGRILLASDGSIDSDRVAEITAQIAKTTRTPVTLVAVVASAGLRARAEEDLALKAGRMRIEGIECATLVVEGVAEKAIAEAAARTRRRPGGDRLPAGPGARRPRATHRPPRLRRAAGAVRRRGTADSQCRGQTGLAESGH
jgi:nucleotide-binding universal stress UspA family protein